MIKSVEMTDAMEVAENALPARPVKVDIASKENASRIVQLVNVVMMDVAEVVDLVPDLINV
jgi:hypothetical protein